MVVANSVVNVANSAANAVVVMADAVAVAARRVAPKDARRAVRKVVSTARVVPKDVRKVVLRVAPKAVAENAASAIRKVAAMLVVKNARNVRPVKPEATAMQKAAPTTVNRAGKAAVADATAAMAVTVASSTHRVTRSSRTLQRPIGRRWLRLRVVRVRATAHRVSARKATGNSAVSAVNAAAAATTAGVIAASGQMARTPHPTP